MDGGIRVNEWLRREGLLTTMREPEERASLDDVGIDWSGTTAWGEGGYYSRVFLNVRGREPRGDRSRPRTTSACATTSRAGWRRSPTRTANPIATKVYKPEEVYPEVNGVAPDLIVHFGDLLWRAVGTVGGDEGIHTFENDTGPDDANHAQDGLFVLVAPGVEPERRDGMHLLDVAPTVLELLGIDAPATMRGRSLLAPVAVTVRGLAAQRYLTPVTATVVLNVSDQPALRPSGRTAIRRRVRPGSAFHLNVTMPFAVVRLRRSVSQRPWRGSRRCRSSIVAACGGVTRAVTVTGLPTFALRESGADREHRLDRDAHRARRNLVGGDLRAILRATLRLQHDRERAVLRRLRGTHLRPGRAAPRHPLRDVDRGAREGRLAGQAQRRAPAHGRRGRLQRHRALEVDDDRARACSGRRPVCR